MGKRLVLALLVLAGCSLDSITFLGGSPDARVDGTTDTSMTDAPSGPLAIHVSTTSLTVTEGMTKPLGVTLSVPPPGALLVTLESSDDTKLGISPAAVLFSSTNWNTPQNITVSGKQDADTSNEAGMITLRSTDVMDPVVVSTTVTDDDGLSLMVSASMLDVGEGSTGTVAVHLSAQPATNVVVMVTSANTAVATTSQSMLTFTPANYAIDQTITVTGMQDADTTNNTTSIDFSSPALTASSLPIQVTDDDVLGIVASSSAVTATEGGTATFTVTLTQVPPGNTTVNVASGSTTVGTVSPATLTFTTANYNVPQTVTITAPDDDDVADNTTAITLMSTGLTTRSVALTVDDDDTQAIIASPAALTVAEGGTTQLALSLAFRPAGSETITVTSLDSMAATVSPAMVTFTTANYATPQMVTVTGVQDADAVPDNTVVRVESTALGLVKDITVNVSEDDTLGIETSTNMITLTEGGMMTLMVRLTAQPTTDTTVMVASGNTAVATASPASLTFTAMNYNTFQAVTVTAVQDNDLATSTTNLTLSASGIPSKVIPVTSNDDDTQKVVAANSTVNVTEGSSTTVGITLGFVPMSNVDVTVTSMLPAAATVTPATLTFTPANYNTPQNITITGTQDADAVNATTMISLTAPSATAAAIMVNVTDDDTLNIELSPTTLTITEGATGTLNVRLTAMPAGTTTVMISTSDAGAASISTSMLTFTTANYNSFQPVTIMGVEDPDAGIENVTITAMATGLTAKTASVTVLDNDPQNFVVSATTVNLGEAGSTTFNVHLAAQPGASATVTVASSDTGAATVSPAMLTFTSANYAVDQIVTVTGVQDQDVGNENVTIGLSSPGIPTVNVTALVADDDMQVVQAAPTNVTVAEGGTTNANVTLAFAPGGSVTVNVASAQPGVAGVTPATLTFNASNYNTPQAISISGTEDPDAANGSTTVSLTLAGATPAGIVVNVTDNDTLGIELSTMSLAIGEGSTGTLGIRLTAQPPGPTTVNLASNDPGAASLSPTSVSFDATNWNVFKSVTVTGVEDADSANENVTITASSGSLTPRTASVAVTDNDVLGIAASPTNLTFGEGASGTVNVHLTAMPPGNVTINVFNPDSGAVSVGLGPQMLMFTPSNYAVDQTVTLTGVQDGDSTDEMVTLTLSAPGMSPVNITANVIDDDLQNFVITPSNLTITEGGTGSFFVSLTSAPTAPLTVNLSSTNSTVAATVKTSLTFTASNYNMPQQVDVSTFIDSNYDFNSAQIRVSAMGVPQGIVDILVSEPKIIDVIDNPNPSFVGFFCDTMIGVRLLGNPLVPLTLTMVPDNLITVTPGFVTFTAADWSTYHPVTVQSKDMPGRSVLQVTGPNLDPVSTGFTIPFFAPSCL